MEKPTIIPGRSPESQLVIERLLRVEAEGDLVTYEDLSTLVGRDVRADAGIVRRAIDHVLAEHGRWFVNVKGVGWRRADPSTALRGGTLQIRKARRATGRGLKILARGCDYERLNRDERTTYNVSTSILGALHSLTLPPAEKKVRRVVEDEASKLSISRTLDAITGRPPEAAR